MAAFALTRAFLPSYSTVPARFTMPRVALAVLLLAAAIGLTGCRREKGPQTAPPAPRVTVIRPALIPVRDYWVYNGYLEQTKKVEVRSKVRGYLTGIKFTEGTEVNPGDLLYTIDKLEFNTAREKAAAEELKAHAEAEKAKAQIESWKAQIEQADADLVRISDAVSKGAESKDKLDLAQATLHVRKAEHTASIAAAKSAAAEFEAAKAALHSTDIMLGYTDIKAKIGGRISRTEVDDGTLVQADTTLLATILKVDQLYVYFDAPEADLVAYQQSLKENKHKDPLSREIRVEVGVTGEDGFPHVGTIDFRENRVETATGTIRIRGVIPNPVVASNMRPLFPGTTRDLFRACMGVDPCVLNNTRMLFPGMFARVRVPKGEATPQTVLPEDCLMTGQEGRFVYVVRPDGKVKKRLVTVNAVVWKATAAADEDRNDKWVAANPSQEKPAATDSPQDKPAPTQRAIKSLVAVTFLKTPDSKDDPPGQEERVILDGLQQARPGSPVAPEEWKLELRPPTKPKN
jgi:RND family efflux transporter MFP subunit